ncbi:RagB/SusD family nutrient uptake outer membrane protein [Sphingobacterium siyangense]|uniref:RagB/SusD family nutrient uptake outer membrane protein n=1 Tax=Sphingobacterium siyangense TaxID=459529 RepID=UPI002FD90E89
MKTTLNLILSVALLIIMASCSKDWLDEKPSKSLVVPQTLKDLQGIVDDYYTLNMGYSLLTISSLPNIYVADDDLGSLTQEYRDCYIWSKEINYTNNSSYDWSFFYQMIEKANLVIDGISKLAHSRESDYILGQAYYFRATGYYFLAQTFCKPYENAHAKTDLGLPIRSTSDVNVLSKRSNLQQVYEQIESDYNHANNLLPVSGSYFTRPTKVAALGMLAKVFLHKQDYETAGIYADSVIKLKPDVIDFNNPLYASHNYPYNFQPMGNGNKEIIFYAFGAYGFQYNYAGQELQVSPDFYNTYSDNDLRKEYFYSKSNNKINFIGTYSGDNCLFQGLSTNEFYFIRSECNARQNKMQPAIADLEMILNKRFKTGTTPNISENGQESFLKILFAEKEREFPRVSNINWEELRRLNLDPRFQKTLKRTVNGKQYTLPPNDPRYVFPIPLEEIKLNALEQNIR